VLVYNYIFKFVHIISDVNETHASHISETEVSEEFMLDFDIAGRDFNVDDEIDRICFRFFLKQSQMFTSVNNALD